jgi:hypothetical protein
MHSVLAILDEPADKTGEQHKNWQSFSLRVEGKLPKEGSIQRLSSHSFLILLDGGLKALGQLIVDAENKGIPLRLHFFEEEPDWVYSQAHPLAAEAKGQ